MNGRQLLELTAVAVVSLAALAVGDSPQSLLVLGAVVFGYAGLRAGGVVEGTVRGVVAGSLGSFLALLAVVLIAWLDVTRNNPAGRLLFASETTAGDAVVLLLIAGVVFLAGIGYGALCGTVGGLFGTLGERLTSRS